jgi:TP901 family phage tail tape measure protein
MGGALGNAVLELSTDNSRLESGLAKAEQSTSGAGKRMASIAGGLALGIGAGVVAGLGAGVKAAGDLQQSVANISTIKPEIDTTAVFASLNKMQRTVPQSAAELGDALYNVFSSVDLKPIMDKNGQVIKSATDQGLQLVQNFAEGAVGAGTDTATFGTAVMGVMNAYKLSVDDAAKVSDVFFNTVNSGVISGQELAGSLGVVTGSAKSAGLSIDEMGGFIVGITKEGGTAQNNLQHLNSLFVKMASPDVLKGFKELGIATTDANGNFLPMTERLGKLKSMLSTMSQSKQADVLKNLFGDETSAAAATVIMSELDSVNKAIDDNKNKAGAAHEAFIKMNATFNSQMGILKNTLSSIGIELGGKLLPYITPIVTWIAQKLPDAMEYLGTKSNEFWPKIQPIIDIFSSKVPGAITTVQGKFLDLQPIFARVQHYMDFLAKTFIENWPKIQSAVRDAIAYMTPWLDRIRQNFQDMSDKVFPKLEKAVAAVVGFIKAHWGEISGTIKYVMDFVGQIITTAMRLIQHVISLVLDVISGDWSAVWNDLGDILKDIWKGITTVLAGAWDTIIAVLNTAAAAFLGILEAAWNTVIDVLNAFAGAFVDTIIMGMQKAWDGIVWAWNGISKWLAGVWKNITNAAGKAANAIGAWWAWLDQAAQEKFQAMGDAIWNAVSWIGNWLKTTWQDVVNSVIGAWNWASTKATEIWQGIVNGITNTVGGAKKLITDVFDGISAYFTELGTTAYNWGVSVIQHIIDGINSMIQKLKDTIGGAYNWARNLLGGGGDSGSGGGGEHQNSPGGHAVGGSWAANTWSWVGEKGPELVLNGRRDSYVFTHEQSMALAGGAMSGGGGTITVVSPIYLDGTQIAQVVRKADRAYVRRNAGA